MAEAALQASDAAALRIGLKELLYLQPETAPALPIRVSNARRTQRLVLEQLERGELTLGPSKLKELNPVIPWQLRFRAGARASDGGVDGDELAAELKLDAIFAESYAVDGEIDEARKIASRTVWQLKSSSRVLLAVGDGKRGRGRAGGSRSARDGGCTFCVLPFGHAGARDLGRAKRVSKPPALFVEEQYGFVDGGAGAHAAPVEAYATGYQGVQAE